MDELSYTTTATAWGGRMGRVATSDGRLDYHLSMPEGMGGEGGDGTNPEQLFACGYAACFHNAVRSVARKLKVDVTDSGGVRHRAHCRDPRRRLPAVHPDRGRAAGRPNRRPAGRCSTPRTPAARTAARWRATTIWSCSWSTAENEELSSPTAGSTRTEAEMLPVALRPFRRYRWVGADPRCRW